MSKCSILHAKTNVLMVQSGRRLGKALPMQHSRDVNQVAATPVCLPETHYYASKIRYLLCLALCTATALLDIASTVAPPSTLNQCYSDARTERAYRSSALRQFNKFLNEK